MPSRLHPYLSFKDNAREAMEFYKDVFGGKLTMTTFKEFDPEQGEGGELIMHSMLEAANGIAFMASDTPAGMEHRPGANISMSLSGENEAELHGYWKKLSEGATIAMPLDKAPWGDIFGMLTDRFGIHWMVNVVMPKP